jgi:phosphate acetyltransferase
LQQASKIVEIITLGLMSMLIGKMAKVGYFRPIIEDFEGGFDNH